MQFSSLVDINLKKSWQKTAKTWETDRQTHFCEWMRGLCNVNWVRCERDQHPRTQPHTWWPFKADATVNDDAIVHAHCSHQCRRTGWPLNPFSWPPIHGECSRNPLLHGYLMIITISLSDALVPRCSLSLIKPVVKRHYQSRLMTQGWAWEESPFFGHGAKGRNWFVCQTKSRCHQHIDWKNNLW